MLLSISLRLIPEITYVVLLLDTAVINLTIICMCVYHGSGPLLVFLAVMVSAVAKALLFRPGQLCPAQQLHSQPVVNHLCTSLTVCQAHLGCTLQEHTEKCR